MVSENRFEQMNPLTITTFNVECISAIISPVLFIGDGAITRASSVNIGNSQSLYIESRRQTTWVPSLSRASSVASADMCFI